MDHLFFVSKFLDRSIYFSDIDRLSTIDMSSLLAEVKIAKGTMLDQIEREKQDCDKDWLHSVHKKIWVCEEFARKIKDVKRLNKTFGATDYKHLVYLREEVINSLGQAKAQVIFDRARDAALAQLSKEAIS